MPPASGFFITIPNRNNNGCFVFRHFTPVYESLRQFFFILVSRESIVREKYDRFAFTFIRSASEGLLHIADCLLTHICHGFDIPSTVSQDLMDRIVEEVVFMWYAVMKYPSPQENAKVGIGFLIAEMWKVRLHRVVYA